VKKNIIKIKQIREERSTEQQDALAKKEEMLRNDKSCETLVKGSVHRINAYHMMGMEGSAGRSPCEGTCDQERGRAAVRRC
jgi:hypothetical protein